VIDEKKSTEAVALEHGMNCPHRTPNSDDDCTCGLRWRIALQTEQTMHAAWRKRAEEAEAAIAVSSQDAVAKECERISITIYMAGDIAQAKQIIRGFCWARGWCVTVTPTAYIYSGGEESGFIVGIENYPRFPSTLDELTGKAKELAERLAVLLFQKSYMICTPKTTFWQTDKMPFEKDS
jgi:hypothetical protein